MIVSHLYVTVKSVMRGSFRTAIRSVSRQTSDVPLRRGNHKSRATVPLLVPEFWWLVVNTVRPKWKHRRINTESYLDYLDEFYTGSATSSHVAVYGDAYKEIRSIVADLAELSPEDTVLDVASGRGYQAAEFARRGYRVTSAELVHDRAKTARDQHPDCSLAAVAGDAAVLPFKDDAFDVVVISLGLHCMPLETWQSVLGEFRWVARKQIVILEPRSLPGRIMRYLYAAVGQLLDESLYFWEFALSDFDANLAGTGLEIARKQRCFHNLFAIYVCNPVSQPFEAPDLFVIQESVGHELEKTVR